ESPPGLGTDERVERHVGGSSPRWGVRLMIVSGANSSSRKTRFASVSAVHPSSPSAASRWRGRWTSRLCSLHCCFRAVLSWIQGFFDGDQAGFMKQAPDRGSRPLHLPPLVFGIATRKGSLVPPPVADDRAASADHTRYGHSIGVVARANDDLHRRHAAAGRYQVHSRDADRPAGTRQAA